MSRCVPAWRRHRGAAIAAAAVALLAACGSSSPAIAPAPAVGDPGSPQVYVAVGASETVGAGIDDDPLRLRDAWPQLFFNAALPRAATFYDLGIPSATTATAMARELPRALQIRPTVVTVWLNVNDIINGVTPDAYETQLGSLVHALRQGGRATVLVATVPVIDDLPAYVACRQGSDPCPLFATGTVPPPDVLDATVDAYNAAVQRVAGREGAVVVDLHAQGDVAQAHPDWVASDGFHPSFLGHAEVARLFAAAYAARRG